MQAPATQPPAHPESGAHPGGAGLKGPSSFHYGSVHSILQDTGLQRTPDLRKGISRDQSHGVTDSNFNETPTLTPTSVA